MGKVAKSTLIAAASGLVVVATSSFTINCGFPAMPPTSIGVERRIEHRPIHIQTKVSANLAALIGILVGHSIVATGANGSECASFDTMAPGVTPTMDGPYTCALRVKSQGDGTIADDGRGECTISEEVDAADATKTTYSLGFAGPEIAADFSPVVITNVDFTKLAGQDLDGYVVSDIVESDRTVTLHNNPKYCADAFLLE